MKIRSVQLLLILLQIYGTLSSEGGNLTFLETNRIDNEIRDDSQLSNLYHQQQKDLKKLTEDVQSIKREVEKLTSAKVRLENEVKSARKDIFALNRRILALTSPDKSSDLPLDREKRRPDPVPAIIFEESFDPELDLASKGWRNFTEDPESFILGSNGSLLTNGTSNGMSIQLPRPFDLLNPELDPTILQFSLGLPPNPTQCKAVTYLCLYSCEQKSEEIGWDSQCLLEIEMELFRDHLAAFLMEPSSGQYLFPHFPPFSIKSHLEKGKKSDNSPLFVTLEVAHGKKRVQMAVDGERTHEDAMSIPTSLKSLKVCSLGLKHHQPEGTCQFNLDNLLVSRDPELAKGRLSQPY